MKKLMWTAVMVLMMCTTMSAQDAGRGKREKATPEQRARRMAEKLMLDDAATAKFVPLYQDYMKALAECRTPRVKPETEGQMTDKELDAQMQRRFECRLKMLDVQKSYYDKFKKVMTVRQVQKLYNQEGPNAFRRGDGKMKPAGQKRKPVCAVCPANVQK